MPPTADCPASPWATTRWSKPATTTAPTAIRLGTSTSTNCANTTGTDLLNLAYSYGTTNNNGNVQSQTIVRPVGTWTQSYSYTDGVNRLTSASESGTGSWSESYGYDAFGNRWVVGNPIGLPPPTNETPQGQNWFLSNNRISGWGYDGRGNLTSIPSMSRTFSYDAENRMTSATVGGASNYFYDGDGRRVQKVTSSGTTTYVYDAMGQLAAEYGATTDSDIGTRFLTSDHLGSTRLKTDSTGAVTNCYDYLPFGEEIALNTAGRTASCFAPTGTDTFNVKFTSKERDAETGLDHAWLRHYAGPQGRWTSPDPFGGRIGDPQTLNRFAYVRNNPLRFIDPFGLNEIPVTCGSTGQQIGTCQGGTSNCNVSGSCQSTVEVAPETSFAPLFKLELDLSEYVPIQPSSGPTTITGSNDVPLNSFAQQVFSQTGRNLRHFDDFMIAFAGGSAAAGAVIAAAPAVGSAVVTGTARAVGYASGLSGGTGVVLGQYDEINSYISAARSMGANYYSIPRQLWNFFDRFGASWAANQAFLDASIARGQQFWLSTNPLAATNTFASELQYLTSRGVGPDQWLMVPLPF